MLDRVISDRTVRNKRASPAYYVVTYDHDSLYAGGAGVIDIVFAYKDNKWICAKSSTFDSTEKARIETRLDTAIVKKLGGGKP